ncbi:peptidase family C78-domain-containing protein, partial [Thamnocephalis sphaerospora]
SHLGKFAHEKKMPTWLAKKLGKDGQVSCQDVIPALQRLLLQSQRTEFAYTSDPRVVHVSKLHREGSFCGYRNIQSLASFIIGAKALGHEHFDHGIPSVFEIQDLIESAWDQGFNAQGRAETGGIKGTRKYIGTPEAQALFCGLGIPSSVEAFRPAKDEAPWQNLIKAVAKYFSQEESEADEKIRRTSLPPIYLQHKGHSMTIVGVEKQGDGSWNLLVLDPSNRDPESIKKSRKSVDKRKRYPQFDLLLEPYRRGEKYLSKYDEFEVL